MLIDLISGGAKIWPCLLNTRQSEAVTVSPHFSSTFPFTTPTHGYFELSPVSLPSRNQDGGPSNSTIDICDLMVKQEIVNRLMLKVLRQNSNKRSRLLVQSCPQATASCFKAILFLNSTESDLTDVHYQDLVHVVMIYQTGLVFSQSFTTSFSLGSRRT